MTSPTTAEVLEAAADLLSKLGAWTQDELACDADGDRTEPDYEDAICWCAEGAIRKFAGGRAQVVFEALRESLGVHYIYEWNDAEGRTQAEVVEALRAAALQASGGGE